MGRAWRAVASGAITGLVVCASPLAVLAAKAPAEVNVKVIGDTPDIEIYFNVKVQPEDVAAVKARILHTSAVRRFAFVDHDAAYAKFRKIFRKDPDVVGSIGAVDLPESFRLELVFDGDARKVAGRFQTMAGVDDVKTRPTAADLRRQELAHRALIRQCHLDDFDVDITLTVDATPDQVTGVRAAIAKEPSISVVRFLDSTATAAQFRCVSSGVGIGADMQGIIDDAIKLLPSGFALQSFELRTAGAGATAALRRLRALPGVMDVHANPEVNGKVGE